MKIGEDALQHNAIIFSSKPQFIKLVVILQYWHILAREAVYYRSMIRDLKDNHLQNHCQQCKSDEDLSVRRPMLTV